MAVPQFALPAQGLIPATPKKWFTMTALIAAVLLATSLNKSCSHRRHP